jgi:hypothetical protein
MKTHILDEDFCINEAATYESDLAQFLVESESLHCAIIEQTSGEARLGFGCPEFMDGIHEFVIRSGRTRSEVDQYL